MKKFSKYAAVATVTAALVLPALPAFAGTSLSGWSVVMPQLQQGVNAGFQTKTTTAGGYVRVDDVGNYSGNPWKVNARMCRQFTPDFCGQEARDIGVGQGATIGSGASVGSTAFLQIFNSVISPVRVEASGVWRSN